MRTRLPVVQPQESYQRKNKTINARTLVSLTRVDGVDEHPLTAEEEALRPKTRADCVGGPRPCPWVSCQHHLYLDVAHKGSILMNFPEIEPGEMATSCALDVADRGGASLKKVAALSNVTRQRIQQLENKMLRKLSHNPNAQRLAKEWVSR